MFRTATWQHGRSGGTLFGQAHLVAEFDRARRELREDVAEVRQDVRDVRAQVAAFENGQYVFSGAIIAGLLGVIATLIATD